MRLIKDIKELLEMNPARLSLFSNSCFGVWLNVPFKDHEPFLIHSMLLNQQEVDEYHTEHRDLQFNVYNYILKFGRREFCICTGLKFGHYDVKPFDSARVVPFRDRVFGHANVTVRHLKEAFDGDEWHNISDVDAVRLCLVMFVEFVLLGREPKNKTHVHLLALVEDLDVFNQFPWGSYTWSVLYKSIRNAAWIHYRRVNVGDGAVDGDGKVGKLEKLKKKVVTALKGKEKIVSDDRGPQYNLHGFIWGFRTWILEILPRSHIWFSKVNDDIVPRALRWHVKIRFGRESYENLFGGFDHDFQPETRRLELTKLEQNQYWWVENERYFEARRVLSRPNDLPPPNPIKNRIPRKPERTNIMSNSTTIWVNAVKEIAELKARINNWTGFGEVDINALIDSGVGMQDHSKVVTDTRMDTVVRIDIGFRMSSGGLMDSGVGEMPDLNFREGDAMDDCNFGLNYGWLNSMSTPQG
ncbi:phospholipase-like protein [Tanacetum coccineum]|uniref:Phospholipase-like protein n=1 Tax=Tanacetum coccineum TaxID=301880 RepID=A0ABQ5AGH3_9ASTR